MTGSGLDSLRRRRGCARCSAPTVAVLRVQLRRRADDGRGEGEMVDGKQMSLCEACALEVWPKISDAVRS